LVKREIRENWEYFGKGGGMEKNKKNEKNRD
jgi:hypothetical protein